MAAECGKLDRSSATSVSWPCLRSARLTGSSRILPLFLKFLLRSPRQKVMRKFFSILPAAVVTFGLGLANTSLNLDAAEADAAILQEPVHWADFIEPNFP